MTMVEDIFNLSAKPVRSLEIFFDVRSDEYNVAMLMKGLFMNRDDASDLILTVLAHPDWYDMNQFRVVYETNVNLILLTRISWSTISKAKLMSKNR